GGTLKSITPNVWDRDRWSHFERLHQVVVVRFAHFHGEIFFNVSAKKSGSICPSLTNAGRQRSSKHFFSRWSKQHLLEVRIAQDANDQKADNGQRNRQPLTRP